MSDWRLVKSSGLHIALVDQFGFDQHGMTIRPAWSLD
jgi:hypothetical protein